MDRDFFFLVCILWLGFLLIFGDIIWGGLYKDQYRNVVEMQVKEKLGEDAIVDFNSKFNGRYKVIAKSEGSDSYDLVYLIKVQKRVVVDWSNISNIAGLVVP